MKRALNEREQRELMQQIGGEVKPRPPQNPIPSNFHVSSGEAGAPQRNERMHEFGHSLYSRFAEEVAKQLSKEEIDAEPALTRLAKVLSGEQPPRVDHVSGVCYLAHSVLANHQDAPNAFPTMSIALGDACDFVVGEKPTRPYKNARVGAPLTLRMESGDALYFDGGSVPHGIPKIHKDTGPAWWKQGQARGFRAARVSVLFREADGWAKYVHNT